jgi:hypothetical protein
MDESERYLTGKYETEEEAFCVCRKIVDNYLLNAYQPDMTAKQPYEIYVCHGEDPFIKEESFSAWNSAEKRSDEIVEAKNKTPEKDFSIDKGSCILYKILYNMHAITN